MAPSSSDASGHRLQRVTTRNATFQHWQTLLTNRTKRHRAGEIVVQGVRPITLAVEAGWPVRSWLYDDARRLSGWASDLLGRVPAHRYAVSAELLRELSGKDEDAPELLAVVGTPADDLARIAVDDDFCGVLFDRPGSPGNIGTIVRSVDALGSGGVIVTGHGADPYDPKAVRASTGSMFTVPVVRAPSSAEVLDRVDAARDTGVPLRLVGTDEHGEVDLPDADLTGPILILTGNETTGLSRAWREACDVTVRIPMHGGASSLNAASATTVVLYEAARQRRAR